MSDKDMQFHLDPELVGYYERNPFRGCWDKAKAAKGRAAEPHICEIMQKQFDVVVLPYDHKKLPIEHKAILGKDKQHDGLIFDKDNNFLGIFEGKLAFRNEIKLNHEEGIARYCARHGLIYILGIAEMIDVSSLLCEVRCFTPLNEHLNIIQQNTAVLVASAISRKIFSNQST